jgi:hypothetical protein
MALSGFFRGSDKVTFSAPSKQLPRRLYWKLSFLSILEISSAGEIKLEEKLFPHEANEARKFMKKIIGGAWFKLRCFNLRSAMDATRRENLGEEINEPGNFGLAWGGRVAREEPNRRTQM